MSSSLWLALSPYVNLHPDVVVYIARHFLLLLPTPRSHRMTVQKLPLRLHRAPTDQVDNARVPDRHRVGRVESSLEIECSLWLEPTSSADLRKICQRPEVLSLSVEQPTTRWWELPAPLGYLDRGGSLALE